MTESPLSAGEFRVAAETHKELGPEYQDAVLDSFVDRVGREIDARVDARLAQAAAQPLAAQRMATPPAPRTPKPSERKQPPSDSVGEAKPPTDPSRAAATT